MSRESPEPEDNAGHRDTSSDTRIVITLGLVGLGFAVLVLLLFRNRDDVAPPELNLTGVSREVTAAISQSREWVLANPSSAQAWGQLGMELRAHEFARQSDLCYEQAEQLDPQDWHWPYLLGVNQTYTDVEGAKACLRRAIALQPEYAPARHRLANLLLGQALVDEARQQLDEVIRRTPDDARALLGLARVEWHHGNIEESRDWAEKSAARLSGQRATHELLSRIYHQLGNRQAALQQLEILNTVPPGKTNWEDPIVANVLRMRRDAEFIVKEAQALFNGGHRQLALRRMQSTVQQHPNRLEFRAELGRMLILAEDLSQAAEVLDEAIEQHPATAELLRLRGVVYSSQRQWQSAVRCFREAIQHKPDHAEAYENLGQCLGQMRDTENAIGAFRDALRFDPTLAGAHANLGRLLLLEGDRLKGIEHLEMAVDLKPDDVFAKRLLEGALARSKGE